ncbi:MAG: CRISPR-associated endonuclease Cas2 [Burkholderiales bacterium]|nr:CRISPR-associated endonuclease Cas2 [Burkholderiales bacterium]
MQQGHSTNGSQEIWPRQSVFECRVDLAGFEEIERRVLSEINPEQDCLRLYRLPDTCTSHPALTSAVPRG